LTSYAYLRIDHYERHLRKVDATNKVDDDLFKVEVSKGISLGTR
jgi:hypothetical protein